MKAKKVFRVGPGWLLAALPAVVLLIISLLSFFWLLGGWLGTPFFIHEVLPVLPQEPYLAGAIGGLLMSFGLSLVPKTIAIDPAHGQISWYRGLLLRLSRGSRKLDEIQRVVGDRELIGYKRAYGRRVPVHQYRCTIEGPGGRVELFRSDQPPPAEELSRKLAETLERPLHLETRGAASPKA